MQNIYPRARFLSLPEKSRCTRPHSSGCPGSCVSRAGSAQAGPADRGAALHSASSSCRTAAMESLKVASNLTLAPELLEKRQGGGGWCQEAALATWASLRLPLCLNPAGGLLRASPPPISLAVPLAPQSVWPRSQLLRALFRFLPAPLLLKCPGQLVSHSSPGADCRVSLSTMSPFFLIKSTGPSLLSGVTPAWSEATFLSIPAARPGFRTEIRPREL